MLRDIKAWRVGWRGYRVIDRTLESAEERREHLINPLDGFIFPYSSQPQKAGNFVAINRLI
jgi:hypothetical protein